MALVDAKFDLPVTVTDNYGWSGIDTQSGTIWQTRRKKQRWEVEGRLDWHNPQIARNRESLETVLAVLATEQIEIPFPQYLAGDPDPRQGNLSLNTSLAKGSRRISTSGVSRYLAAGHFIGIASKIYLVLQAGVAGSFVVYPDIQEELGRGVPVHTRPLLRCVKAPTMIRSLAVNARGFLATTVNLIERI